LRNAWVGCFWPVARNVILSAISFVAAVAVGLAFNSWMLGIGTLIGLVVLHDTIRRRYWKPRDDTASDRFF
jgi:hypothetical protein